MKKNIGFFDRLIRFVAVDLLLGFSFLGFDIPPLAATLAFVISISLILTIITGYSLLYQLLHFSTVEGQEVAE